MDRKQTRERRSSAAARITLVVALCLVNIGLLLFFAYYLHKHVTLIYLLLQVLGVVVAVRVQSKGGSPSYKLAWTIVILVLPAAGLIMYELWGGNTQRKRSQRHPVPYPPHKDFERSRSVSYLEKMEDSFPTWVRTARHLSNHDFMLYKNTQATYLPSGEDYFADLITRLEKAEHFIFMEYFIVAEGKIWDRIFAILRERITQGVEVKIIFDDFGNIARMSGEMIDAMQECGIEVKIFNPVHQYVNRLYFNYRDHRKICCIDGDFAYTGGINLADEYANILRRFGHWRDSGVCLEGEGAWGLTRMFIHMWEWMGGELQNEYDYYRPHGPVKAEGWCQPFCDGPLNNPENPVEDLFLQAISTARHFVYITTPYLAIEESMVQDLCITADSGVDVRIFLPGIPDHWYTQVAAGAYYDVLLSHGVRIFHYTPGFLHSKLMVCDGEMAMVGSVNMDYRSFQLHYECGTVLYGMSAVEHVLREILACQEQCEEIHLPKWRRRNVFRRMAEAVLKIFTIWM